MTQSADEPFQEIHTLIEAFLARWHPVAPVAYRELRRALRQVAERRGTTVDEVLAQAMRDARSRGRETVAEYLEYLGYLDALPVGYRLLQTVNPVALLGPHTFLAWRLRQDRAVRESE